MWVFRTLEMLKADFASGKEVLKPDEYLNNGLPYCKKCKQARWYSSDDNLFAIRGLCKCQEEQRLKEQQMELKQKRMLEFNNRQKLSLLGERYKNIMFRDATITQSNVAIYNKARNYVQKSDVVLNNNIGLYIYGDNSSGKTFLTACMCNELVWKGYRCVYTNLATILNEIRASYDGKGLGVCELVGKLNTYDFA